jgi:hypothetical protein
LHQSYRNLTGKKTTYIIWISCVSEITEDLCVCVGCVHSRYSKRWNSWMAVILCSECDCSTPTVFWVWLQYTYCVLSVTAVHLLCSECDCTTPTVFWVWLQYSYCVLSVTAVQLLIHFHISCPLICVCVYVCTHTHTHTHTRESQKIRFPILLPPNNLT